MQAETSHAGRRVKSPSFLEQPPPMPTCRLNVEELEAAITKLKSGKAPGREIINSVNKVNKHNVGCRCVFEINTDFF